MTPETRGRIADRLVVVTATTNAARFALFQHQLRAHAEDRTVPIVALVQGGHAPPMSSGLVLPAPTYKGVVPAFALACQAAIRAYPQAEVIACLHDDVEMYEAGWDLKLLAHFDEHPACGLAGFGGAWGLGDEQAGQGEYRPTWLVRRGFMSNMPDAEVHGSRCVEARPVAVLDGFSQVFRVQALVGGRLKQDPRQVLEPYYDTPPYTGQSLFTRLQDWGVVHHAYDAALGIMVHAAGWETWYLPFYCRHLGGQTAVGDPGYATWAFTQRPDAGSNHGGDQAFWSEAHRIVWEKLGRLLPFEVGERL